MKFAHRGVTLECSRRSWAFAFHFRCNAKFKLTSIFIRECNVLLDHGRTQKKSVTCAHEQRVLISFHVIEMKNLLEILLYHRPYIQHRTYNKRVH